MPQADFFQIQVAVFIIFTLLGFLAIQAGFTDFITFYLANKTCLYCLAVLWW